MAWTAIHAEDLKRESGATMNGQSCGEPVFTFSLSWHPEEDPQKWDMIRAGRTALQTLGLENHETLMVSHTDREHPHMHVIVNVVDPDTGKAHSLSFSKKKLSEWAEDYERQHGKIYCDQRVENNAKRQQGEYVKYQEPEVDPKAQITELYQQSDNGAAFQAGLAELGYTLAQGKRLVLIDQQGKIHSLSRQIEGAKAKDIRAKLADLELPDLDTAREQIASLRPQSSPKPEEKHGSPDRDENHPSPTTETIESTSVGSFEKTDVSLEEEKKSETTVSSNTRSAAKQADVAEPFDRDQQDRDWQESIIDAAIEHAEQDDRTRKRRHAEGESGSQGKRPDQKQQKESAQAETEPVQPSEERSENQDGRDQARSKKLKELFPLPDRPTVSPSQLNQLQDRHLAELGHFYDETARSRSVLGAKLEAQYGEQQRQLRQDIDHLGNLLQNSGRLRRWWLKTTNQIPQNAEQELSNMRKTLENIEWRKQEAEQALRSQTDAQRSAMEVRQKLERSELDPDQSAERGRTTHERNPELEDDGPSFDY